MSWTLTVRHGSQVDREKFEDAAGAIAAAHAHLERIRSEGGLPPISALRDFTPGQRVHARLEIDGPGLFRGPKGGIDLMGDGTVVAYTGTIRKEPIEGDSVDRTIELLSEALRRRG